MNLETSPDRGKGHFWLMLIIGILIILFGLVIVYVIEPDTAATQFEEKKGILASGENTKRGWEFTLEGDTNTYRIFTVFTPALNGSALDQLAIGDTCTLLCEENYIYAMSFGRNEILAKEDALELDEENDQIGKIMGWLFALGGLGMVLGAFVEKRKDKRLNQMTEEEYENYLYKKKIKDIQWSFLPFLIAPYAIVFFKLIQKSFELNISVEVFLSFYTNELLSVEFTTFHLIALALVIGLNFVGLRFYEKGIRKVKEQESRLARLTAFYAAVIKAMYTFHVGIIILIVSLLFQGNVFLYSYLALDLIFKAIYLFPTQRKMQVEE